MSSSWVAKRLADLCQVFADGDWVESKDQSESGFRLVQTGNVGNGDFKDRADKARYISEETFDRLKCSEVFSGDTLISRLPEPVGRSCILPQTGERMVTVVDCTIARFDENQILPRYFSFYAQSDSYFGMVAEACTGTTRSRVSRSNLGRVLIPVPPLAEQRRIVAVLDEAFAGLAIAKANTEKNLQNARALFESHLQSVFAQQEKGWEQKTLKEISIRFGRGRSRHRPRDAPHLYGGSYPFVQTGDIRTAGHTITEYSRTYSEAGLAQSMLWPKGTVCITIAANIAETAVLGFDACFPDSVVGVVPDPAQADAEFVEYRLHSLKASLQAMGKGSAQANINLGTFERKRFAFPPVGEQRRIVELLDRLRTETEALASSYESKLKALDLLKQSLLHQAFTGNLT